MPLFSTAYRPLFAAAALALAGSAHATLLNFDTWSNANRLSYGDRVSVFGPGYGNSGGATPNVMLEFVDMRAGFGTPESSFFSLWGSGYGSLQNALGHGNYNVPAQIRLQADPGFLITLQSFQVGAWSSSSYPDSRIWITDDQGQVLFDTGTQTFGNNQTLLYQPMASSQGTLTLHINDLGDLGLDNVVFMQSPVPEPGTWLLLGSGLLALGGPRLKRDAGPR